MNTLNIKSREKLTMNFRTLKRNLRDFYYDVWGYWHRYSTVKSRHLPHTWCDRDMILEYTMFEILEQFLEKEADQVEWYGEYGRTYGPEDKNVMDEMKEIIEWWHKNRVPTEPECPTDHPKNIFTPVSEYLVNWDEEFEDEDHKKKYYGWLMKLTEDRYQREKELEDMLVRIVKIRKCMWT